MQQISYDSALLHIKHQFLLGFSEMWSLKIHLSTYRDTVEANIVQIFSAHKFFKQHTAETLSQNVLTEHIVSSLFAIMPFSFESMEA